MSPDLLAPSIDASRLRDCLAQLCARQDEFQHFFSGVFDQLGVLSAELVRRQKAWLRERAETNGDMTERAVWLDNQRTELAAERAQLDRQRRALRKESATAHSEQAAHQNELTAALGEARAELAEAREEIRRQREQIEALRATATSIPADNGLVDRLREMEKMRGEMLMERTALETELEAVRGRAADMAETMAVLRQETASERSQWADELKRIRRLVERLAEQDRSSASSSPPQNAAPASVETAPAQSRATAAEPGDPVLDSVMAQFEMLQRDLARRRKSCEV